MSDQQTLGRRLVAVCQCRHIALGNVAVIRGTELALIGGQADHLNKLPPGQIGVILLIHASNRPHGSSTGNAEAGHAGARKESVIF